MAISRSTSVALDLLRAGAALIVFLQHANYFVLDSDALAMLTQDVGHGAVVIFFVLSGFVIAATTDRDRPAADYVLKRISRIYSVAVPALLLTAGLSLIEAAAAPAGAPVDYELRRPLFYLALHLAFVGDLGPLHIAPFSDLPYWSLDYEVWYYAAYGCAVFLRGTARHVAVGVILLLMTPKLLLLLPVWLGGVGAHALMQRIVLPRVAARACAILSSMLIVGYFHLHLAVPIGEFGRDALGLIVAWPLRYSQWFLSDYLVGVLAVALVWSLCSAEFSFPRWVTMPGVKLAKVSFSLYLVHVPLMQFLHQVLPGRRVLAVGLSFCLAVAFGAVFERQRERLRKLLAAMMPRPSLAAR